MAGLPRQSGPANESSKSRTKIGWSVGLQWGTTPSQCKQRHTTGRQSPLPPAHCLACDGFELSSPPQRVSPHFAQLHTLMPVYHLAHMHYRVTLAAAGLLARSCAGRS